MTGQLPLPVSAACGTAHDAACEAASDIDARTGDVTLRRDAPVIAVVGLAHGVSHFFHVGLATLLPWLREDFGLTYAQLGLLMTAFFVVSGAGQAIAGAVVDRFGARRVLLFGLATLGIATLTWSGARSIEGLFAGALLAGLGNCVFHPADFSLLNQRVSAGNVPHAFSMHGLLGSAGLVLAPGFLAGIAMLAGWRAALQCAALLPLGAIVLLVLYRPLLDGTGHGHAAAEEDRRTAAMPTLHVLRLPAVWTCFAFFVLSSLVIGAVQSFSQSALRDLHGLSLAQAALAFTLFMAAAAAGTLLGGFLAARSYRHETVLVASMAASAAFALLLAPGIGGAMLASLAMAGMGLGWGVAGPSRDLMIRNIARPGTVGRVYGVVYAGLDVGLAIAPMLFAIPMATGHVTWLFLIIAMLQLASVVPVLATRRAGTVQA